MELIANPSRRNPVPFTIRPFSVTEFTAIYEHILKLVDEKVRLVTKFLSIAINLLNVYDITTFSMSRFMLCMENSSSKYSYSYKSYYSKNE